MDTRCFISVGLGERYALWLRRLKKSVEKHWSGPTLYYDDQTGWPPGSLPHHVSNYAFKVYAMREAERRGHRILVYADTSVVARKSLDSLFGHVRDNGYVFVDDSHPIRDWSSDALLSWIGLERGDIGGKHSVSGGFAGLNLDHPDGRLIYEAWQDAVQHQFNQMYWRDTRPNRASSLLAPIGDEDFCVSSDETVLGHMGDEAVLSVLFLKHGYIAVDSRFNPWCSMSRTPGDSVFYSAGYSDAYLTEDEKSY